MQSKAALIGTISFAIYVGGCRSIPHDDSSLRDTLVSQPSAPGYACADEHWNVIVIEQGEKAVLSSVQQQVSEVILEKDRFPGPAGSGPQTRYTGQGHSLVVTQEGVFITFPDRQTHQILCGQVAVQPGSSSQAVPSTITLETSTYDHTQVLRNWIRNQNSGQSVQDLVCGNVHFANSGRQLRSCWTGLDGFHSRDNLREFEIFPLEMHVYTYGSPIQLVIYGEGVDKIEDAHVIPNISCEDRKCTLTGNDQYPLKTPIFPQATQEAVKRLNVGYMYRGSPTSFYNSGEYIARLFLYKELNVDPGNIGKVTCRNFGVDDEFCKVADHEKKVKRGYETVDPLWRLSHYSPIHVYVGCDIVSCYLKCPSGIDPAAPAAQTEQVCPIRPESSRP